MARGIPRNSLQQGPRVHFKSLIFERDGELLKTCFNCSAEFPVERTVNNQITTAIYCKDCRRKGYDPLVRPEGWEKMGLCAECGCFLYTVTKQQAATKRYYCVPCAKWRDGKTEREQRIRANELRAAACEAQQIRREMEQEQSQDFPKFNPYWTGEKQADEQPRR